MVLVKYMKLKRMVKDVKNFTDRYGKPFEKDYGGAPNIVNPYKRYGQEDTVEL